MTIAVRAEEIGYRYSGATVLRKVSLTVSPGEFFVIAGPNGSGKTTLLKTLAGIFRPQAGAVSVMGTSLAAYGKKALARVVAYVPQAVDDSIPFTVLQTALLGRTPHLGMLGLESGPDYDIALEALAITGSDHLAHRRIEQLSGGERQRVHIARAICQEPQVLLLDEPTASLDPAHQIRIMDLMDKLRASRGMAVIMVSHDLNIAAMYADKILMLKEGEVVHRGTPGEVLIPDILERTYACRMMVDESPAGPFPRVLPLPKKFE
ncbi:MAG: ABC transporter ATP-binding protein [Desulfobacterales bacterium]|nr:ABC transporter ATP-binding protein [Desulfobacterales bacterium]